MRKRISVIILATLFTLISCASVVNAATTSKSKTRTTTTPTTTTTTTATSSVTMGAWLGAWPSSSKMNIESFNQLTNSKTQIIHTFVNSNQDIAQWGFMNYVNNQGAKNLLTLELKKSDYTSYNTADVNNGLLDEYFKKIAIQLKGWQNGKEIWLRPMHEVNGNWYGWSIGDSTVNTNDSYKKAFQRMVNIFRTNGATNVKFIYNVNYENVGKNSSFMGAYPGDAYVDYLSMDGYNWGTTKSWSSWRSFRQVFDSAYNALAAGSSKSIIIAEYASTEIGGNKAAWITDAKKQMNSGVYPRLKAAVWFNQNKETDWRIESSAASLTAYKS